MARLTHRWNSIEEVPKLAFENIPGLLFDKRNPVVMGYADALSLLNIDISKAWPSLTKNTQLTFHPELPLRKYQEEGVNFVYNTLVQNSGCILADDMGLGKTRTAIYTASQLPNCNHILITTPANVMYQWAEEAAIFKLPSHVLGPPSKGKKFAQAWKNAELGLQSIYITSYNLSNKALDAFPTPPQCIILDEPHTCLRGRTGKWAWALSDHMNLIRYRLATTGTPMFNQPRDLWFILFLLFRNRFGKAKEFDARYCDGKQGTYGWENKGATNLDELRRRLSHYMLRRTTEDVALQLPPLTTSFKYIEATPQAQAAMMKVTSGGPAVDEALRACLDAKVDTAVETALEMEPCIVFTYHRHHADEIAAKIEKSGGKAISFHGGIGAHIRHNMVKMCAQTRTTVVCTIDSMGTGTNLQGITSDMVFHTIERSPKKTHQAIKRTHRSGQDKPGRAVFLVMKDAMDEIIKDTVLTRLDTWEKLMGRDTMNKDVGDAMTMDQNTEDEILRQIYASMKQ